MSDSRDAEIKHLQDEVSFLKNELEKLQKLYKNDLEVNVLTEAKLIKEKEFSAKILDSLPGIFYLYTYPELKLIRWNKNHETQLGFTAEEMQNRYIMDWHIPGVEPLVQQAVDLVMEKGQNVLESPLLNKQGEYIPFLMTGMRFEMENQLYLMGFGIDITDRKRIELEREKSEALFRLMAENSTDMISRYDENGIYLYASPACKTLLGYNQDELVGQSAFDFFHPDDVAQIEASLKSILDKECVSTTTYRLRRKDGNYLWVETISKAIRDQQTGRVSEIHATSRDITERKKWEEKLLESEQKLSALFSAMTEMVVLHEVVFDESGEPVNYRIIGCNDAFTRITGIKMTDAIGKLATEVYQQKEAPYLKEFAAVGITGVPFEYTTYYAPMDKHFMISVVSPGKNKFATITTDVTTIQQIQDAITEKNKELENYLYVASHDLRSPLVNIQGFSQRLQKQVVSISGLLQQVEIEDKKRRELDAIIKDDLAKTLGFIFTNVSKMDNLINGLLQISRTGRIKMNIKEIHMDHLIEQVIQALNFQINECNAIVKVDGLAGCFGDANQLSQLFTNLLTNAIKYRDKNRQLKIEIGSEFRYHRVLYWVKDNGLGISPRHQKRIWDVFYRVDSASPVSGEGLGLSIAKRIVDKHKGKIWVESEEGKGSTFFIELQRNEFSE